MNKKPENSGKKWSDENIAVLKKMSKTRPVGLIAYELKRSEKAVYKKAAELKVSLMPPEKPPYGRPRKS